MRYYTAPKIYMQTLESMLEAERSDVENGIEWRAGGMAFGLSVVDMVSNHIEDGLACGALDEVEERHYAIDYLSSSCFMG